MPDLLLIFDPEGNDISDEVEIVNGKANPFGWSAAQFQYKGEIIGSHHCGEVFIDPPYTHTITKDGA